ncbi:FAD-dependent oxidoreductase [Pleurocapsales cyanobacterium LEGE 10410]|nr:FAD-dependent oxidoreductase [Pleurocapsales cyanobacterium LEGE 10410]
MFDRDRLSRTDSSCIVIGGGITGLTIATVLQQQGVQVTVLDKGRGIGGRLATRRVQHSESIKGVFDYGTQYFSIKHPRSQTWVNEWLQQGVIREWCRGFGETDDKPRYCGVNGTRGIAKHLAQDLAVHSSTKVVKISYNTRWSITTEGDRQFEGDILVMAPPVPQSLDLLDNSQIVLPSHSRTSLEQISYHSCIAVLALLEQPSSIPAPGGIALADESLIWLADNYQKGISPQGHAITLHATPQFSEAYWNNKDAEIANKLFTAASNYLNSNVVKYQVHRWRYSLPKTLYHEPYFVCSSLPLVMAGDAFVAPKIEGAMQSGFAAAQYISNSLL